MRKKSIFIVLGIMTALAVLVISVQIVLRIRLESYSNTPINSLTVSPYSRFFAIDHSGTCYAGSADFPGGLGTKHGKLLEFCYRWMLYEGMVKIFDDVAYVEDHSLITKAGDLYVFGSSGFETPKLIRNNVSCSFSLVNNVYFVDRNGSLFSFDFSTKKIQEYPFNNVASLNGVQINEKNYLFLLGTNGVLSVYEEGENGFGTPIKQYKDVGHFDVSKSVEDLSDTKEAYLLGMIKTDGTVWIDGVLSQNGTSNSQNTDVKMRQIDGYGKKIACYAHGILYLDDKSRVHVYGYDIVGFGDELLQMVLLENVKDISSGFYSAGVVDADGSMWMWGDSFRSAHRSFDQKPYRVK